MWLKNFRSAIFSVVRMRTNNKRAQNERNLAQNERNSGTE